MERNIAREFTDWTEEAIVKRTGQFKKWAKKRWQIESKDLAEDKGDSSEGDEEDGME